MNRIPFIVFFIILCTVGYFGYTIFIKKNTMITTNVKDAQIRYRVLEGELRPKRKELYDTKSYEVLGRTPLAKNLEKGRYAIIIAKSGHVPIISEIEITDDQFEKSYHLEAGYRYVDSKRMIYKGKSYKTNGFYLAEKETTNREYIQFCEATGHRLPLYIDDPKFNGKENPVMGINYDDAMAYANWRSEVSGLNIRLPYEYEWMFAATDGDTNRIYPWGIHETTTSSYLANYHPFDFFQKQLMPKEIDGYKYTSPVGSFPRTDKKFYDLAGNVFEWCLDTLELNNYPDHNLEVDKDPSLAKYGRIVKGGSWNFNQRMMNVKHRVFVDGRITKGNTGIRLLVEFN